MTADTTRLLDTKTMAAALSIDVWTLRELVKSGRVTAYKIGVGPKAQYRFDPAEVRDALRTSAAS
jgi:excisionase family DNA binding protein